MKKIILPILLLLTISSVLAGDINVTSCIYPSSYVTANNRYFVTQDIVETPSFGYPCFDILSQDGNITLDCQGHWINRTTFGGSLINEGGVYHPDVIIQNCNFGNWSTGVYIGSGDNIKIINTTFYDTTNAIRLDDPYYAGNLIENVTIDCSGTGIQIGDSSNNPTNNINVRNNTIQNCAVGVLTGYRYGGSYYNNYFYGNNVSVSLSSTAGEFRRNKFYNNLFNDTYTVDVSSVNYRNDFYTSLVNGTPIFGDGYQIGGNYWSSYSDSCVDADEDGFCDVALVFLSSPIVQDAYPLANPPPPPPQPVTETLSDVGQGVGNMLLGFAAPMAVLLILLALGSALGYLFASLSKSVGGNV
jgi:hypothetical protein